MNRPVLPIALAAAALLGLSACETTDTTAERETIRWNTPAQPPATPETRPAPPHAGPPAEPECREYQTTVTIGGKPQKAFSRACRQPDGTWKEEGVRTDRLESKAPGTPTEQSFPYGWYGYEYLNGPRYGPGGLSVGVGAGSGGGYMGYGVGF